VGANATAYQDTMGLNPSTLYVYRVCAYNAGGRSAWSNEASATTLGNTGGGGVLRLSGLTLYPPAIRDNGANNATTATVTLSKAADADTVVTLWASTDTPVSLPVQVVVPAGSRSANFTVQSTAPVALEGKFVVVSAKIGDWVQSATLTIMSGSVGLAPQSLNVLSGNGMVLLQWVALPENSVKQYHVLRRAAGSNFFTQLGVTGGSMFADTGLVNGTAYQYLVTAEDWSGQMHSATAVSSTPTASQFTLAWSSAPAVASGRVVYTGTTAAPADRIRPVTLLVDGKVYGSGGYSPGNGFDPLTVALDSEYLSDGAHTVQLVLLANDLVMATPPLAVQVSNTSVYDKGTYIFNVNKAQTCTIEAMAPDLSTGWTVRIENTDNPGVVVRTWSVSENTDLRLAWDGTDSSGTPAPDGDYAMTAEFTFADGSVRRIIPKHVLRIDGEVQALVMVDLISNDKNKDKDVGNSIGKEFKKPGARTRVLFGDRVFNSMEVEELKGVLASTVTNFYLYGHGRYTPVPPQFQSQIDPSEPLVPPWVDFRNLKVRSAAPAGVTYDFTNLVIPSIVGQRRYNFVMIDACNGAGGPFPQPLVYTYSDAPIQPPVYSHWARAFHIGDDPNWGNTLITFNGATLINGNSLANQSWADWRKRFFAKLGRGETPMQAYGNSNPTSTLIIKPTDSSGGITRIQFFGDPEVTWLP
jgi:hypothetical protein